MKNWRNWTIAVLVAVIAVGGIVGAVSATSGEETVEAVVFQRVSDGSIYLATKVEGESWAYTEALDMSRLTSSGHFRLSPVVNVSVPVEAESQDYSASGIINILASVFGIPGWVLNILAWALGLQ